MRITVARVPRPNVAQDFDVPETATVEAVLRLVGAKPDAVIVLREETPIPLDARLESGDALRIVSVFSGG